MAFLMYAIEESVGTKKINRGICCKYEPLMDWLPWCQNDHYNVGTDFMTLFGSEEALMT